MSSKGKLLNCYNNKRRFENKKPNNKIQKMDDGQNEFPQCTTCGNRHNRECYQKSIAYVIYGNPRHQIKDYLSLKEKDT